MIYYKKVILQIEKGEWGLQVEHSAEHLSSRCETKSKGAGFQIQHQKIHARMDTYIDQERELGSSLDRC